MSYFDIKFKGINNEPEKILEYVYQMEDYIEKATQIMHTLRGQGEAFTDIKKDLCDTIEQMEAEKESLKSMRHYFWHIMRIIRLVNLGY